MNSLKVTQEPIIFVDSTPDEGYPLRILCAYRENCNCKWTSEESNPTVDVMNAACNKRVVLLDRAIAILDEKNEVANITPDMSEGEDEYWVEWFRCPNCDDAYITRLFKYCPHCGVELHHVAATPPDVVEKPSSI